MQKNKLFKHIEFFYDIKANKTIFLFALDQSIDYKLFENKQDFVVKINGLGINAESMPHNNFESDYAGGKKLLWIQCCIPGPRTKFLPCKCILYEGEKKLGEKYICFGYKLRYKIISKQTLIIKSLFENCILHFFQPRIKLVVSLHLWHLDVAKEILTVFKQTSKYYELRLAIPENLDVAVMEQLLQHLDENYYFHIVTTLVVPAVGRDIGGFISSLIHSIQDPAYISRPHLFIHTKNTPHLHPIIVNRWRESLINEIAEEFKLAVTYFLFKFAKASIIYSRSNDRKESGKDDIEERKESYNLSKKLSMELFAESRDNVRFCAGTMMWVMPARVEKVWSIEKLQAVLSKLEPSPTMQEPSHAHAFERLFPDIVRSFGLKVFRI